MIRAFFDELGYEIFYNPAMPGPICPQFHEVCGGEIDNDFVLHPVEDHSYYQMYSSLTCTKCDTVIAITTEW